MAEQFDKIVNINVNSQSIDELDKSLENINKEIELIKKNEINLNQTLEEQTKVLEKLNELDKQRNETISQKNALVEASLTDTEKLAKLELEASKEAKKASDEQKKSEDDINKKREESIKRADDLSKAAQGIGGAFEIAAGASVLFGGKTGEELEKAQAKVIGLVGAVDGIKKVVEGSVSGFKLLKEGIDKSAASSNTFGKIAKLAISGTGIGLLVVGLALVLTYFEDIIKFGKELADSLGLTEIIEQVTTFSDKIGGISGFFTLLQGVVKGVVKELVNFVGLIGNILTFDFEAAEKNIQDFGSFVVEETVKAVEKAEAEANLARLIKRKEGIIKANQQEIELLKARGESTLALEKENIDLRIDLIKIRLKAVEKGTEEELKLQEDLNKELVNLEANRKAQADKNFNDNLASLQKNYNKRQKVLVDSLAADLTKEEEFAVKSYQNSLDLVTKEIALRKKRGEDVSALQLKQSELILAEEQRVGQAQVKAIEDANNANIKAIEEAYLKQQIAEQENFEKGYINQKQLNDNLIELNKQYQQEKLELTKEGSIENLQLQKSINDQEVSAITKANSDKLASDLYYVQKQQDANNSILNNTKKSYKDRIQALEDLTSAQIQQIEIQQQAEADANGTSTLQYQKLADEKEKIEEDSAKKSTELRIQQANEIAQASQTVLSGLQSLNNAINELQQQQIDSAQENIDNISKQNDDLQEKIDTTNQMIEESTSKINELEGSLLNSRAERTEQTKAQLNDERANRVALAKQEKKLADEKIANEKRIQAEKDKIERIQKQQKEREKALAITQAVINTALAVTNALTVAPFPLGLGLAILAGVTGAVEIATISSAKYEKGGVLEGNSHSQGGIKGTGRFNNVEVEGGEFIVNKKSTQQYLPLLHEINGNRVKMNNNKFADGGVLPDMDTINSIQQTSNEAIAKQSDTPMYVSVTEINTVQKKVAVIENSGTF